MWLFVQRLVKWCVGKECNSRRCSERVKLPFPDPQVSNDIRSRVRMSESETQSVPSFLVATSRRAQLNATAGSVIPGHWLCRGDEWPVIQIVSTFRNYYSSVLRWARLVGSGTSCYNQRRDVHNWSAFTVMDSGLSWTSIIISLPREWSCTEVLTFLLTYSNGQQVQRMARVLSTFRYVVVNGDM